jgi:hypothetical protein
MESDHSEEDGLRSRELLTTKRVAFVILLFWVISVIPLYASHVGVLLRPLLPDPHTVADRSGIDLTPSRHAVEALEIIAPSTVLISAVLLYLPVVLSGTPAERKTRRGEVLTGILNIHILMAACACLLVVVPSRGELIPSYIAVGLFFDLLRTVSWCLIAFHVCEGRLLLPLVGIILSIACVYIFWPILFFVFHIVGIPLPGTEVSEILVFIWQAVFLLRAGSGFPMFPTGFLRAVSRCGRVFLPIWIAIWILWGNAWDIARDMNPYSFDHGLAYALGHGMVWGWAVHHAIAYLVSLFFLTWPGRTFVRRSKTLILILSGAVAVLNLGLYSVNSFYLGLMAPLDYSWTPGLPYWVSYLLQIILGTMWQVFAFLSLLRWWTRNRMLRPVLVFVGAYLLGLAPLLVVRGGWYEIPLPILFSQVAGVSVVFAVLFRRAPSTASCQ